MAKRKTEMPEPANIFERDDETGKLVLPLALLPNGVLFEEDGGSLYFLEEINGGLYLLRPWKVNHANAVPSNA